MRTWRPFYAIALSFALVLTSAAMATARGHARSVAGHVVLCAGFTVIVVSVDAQGQPVEEAHLCPDCALKSLGAGPTAPGSGGFQSARSYAVDLPREQRGAFAVNRSVRARGPPSA
ncbi:MAG: hypothetical protein AAF748_06020 [Pseudomonadota bacterium]